MADVAGYYLKSFGGGFSGQRFNEKLIYDFSKDGAVANADQLLLGLAKGDCIIDNAVVYVETLCTSGGSLVANIGIKGGDVDAFLANSAGAVASLTAGTSVKETAGQKIKVSAGEYISLDTATDVFTAGRICVYISGVKL